MTVTQRRLGRSSLSITPLVLGGNVFGWTADKSRSFEILDRFVEAGLQAIDTADVYSNWIPGNRGGESESIIGEWLDSRRKRDAVVLITKVGMRMRADSKGLSGAYIARAVEDSLRRLRTDHIDLYFSHEPDAQTSHEETLAAYERLIDAGKVRAIGASNFDAAQLRAALDASAAGNLPRYEVIEPLYNLYDRDSLEGPLLDLCKAEEIGVITYYGLASGFLSGKYRSETDLRKSVRGSGVAKYLDQRGQRILRALDEVAAESGATPAEVALAWIIAQPGVTAPIASATSLAQVDSLIRASRLHLSSDQLGLLDSASRPGS